MELTSFLSLLAVVLPVAYGAPTQAATSLHPKIVEAMKRDLGLTAEQASARVAHDLHASSVIEQVRGSLGDSFAGGWIDGGKIYVGVTDQASANAVTAAGATPVAMSATLSKLEKAQKDLNELLMGKAKDAKASAGIASHYVDVAANKLVIETLADSRDHGRQLASQVGLSEKQFDVRTVSQMPSARADIIGGDAFLNPDAGLRCSIGFAVTSGFISAGHCGQRGQRATDSNGTPIGTFYDSIFPGNDMSYIQGVQGDTLYGYVDDYQGSYYPIRGSQEAAVGASICRSGSTTGLTCGTIQAKGQTVQYAEGYLYGLTATNACSDHGDSGGSFFTNDQAQGVLSGGNGQCTSYYQPVNPILQKYGLTLYTA